jgi:hypothetical protein
MRPLSTATNRAGHRATSGGRRSLVRMPRRTRGTRTRGAAGRRRGWRRPRSSRGCAPASAGRTARPGSCCSRASQGSAVSRGLIGWFASPRASRASFKAGVMSQIAAAAPGQLSSARRLASSAAYNAFPSNSRITGDRSAASMRAKRYAAASVPANTELVHDPTACQEAALDRRARTGADVRLPSCRLFAWRLHGPGYARGIRGPAVGFGIACAHSTRERLAGRVRGISRRARSCGLRRR